jgi:hypothetical protein
MEEDVVALKGNRSATSMSCIIITDICSACQLRVIVIIVIIVIDVTPTANHKGLQTNLAWCPVQGSEAQQTEVRGILT